jgi:hypothetical protein
VAVGVGVRVAVGEGVAVEEGVGVRVAVGEGVAVEEGVGVRVAVGEGVAVGVGAPPDGAPRSSVMLSSVAWIATPVVAPNRNRVAAVVNVSRLLAANGAPKGASPSARKAANTAVLPLPRFWCSPTR